MNRVQFPVLVQVFNQCAWSPDMRHKEMTIQERGRSRPGSGSTYGKQHFPTAVLQSRIVAIGALFRYTSLWAACLFTALLARSPHNPSYLISMYMSSLHTHDTARKREMNLA